MKYQVDKGPEPPKTLMEQWEEMTTSLPLPKPKQISDLYVQESIRNALETIIFELIASCSLLFRHPLDSKRKKKKNKKAPTEVTYAISTGGYDEEVRGALIFLKILW